MSIEVTHKYPWKKEQFATIGVLLILSPVIWFLTKSALTTEIVAAISVIFAAFLLYLNHSRLTKSALKAVVDDKGILTVTGNGMEGAKNRVNVSNVSDIRFDKYAFHPTIMLNTRSGGTNLKLPKRIALVEPLRQYLKDTIPSNVFVAPEAAEVLDEIIGSGKVATKVNREKERLERTAESVASADAQEKLGAVEGVGTDEEIPFTLIGGNVPVVETEADKTETEVKSAVKPAAKSSPKNKK